MDQLENKNILKKKLLNKKRKITDMSIKENEIINIEDTEETIISINESIENKSEEEEDKSYIKDKRKKYTNLKNFKEKINSKINVNRNELKLKKQRTNFHLLKKLEGENLIPKKPIKINSTKKIISINNPNNKYRINNKDNLEKKEKNKKSNELIFNQINNLKDIPNEPIRKINNILYKEKKEYEIPNNYKPISFFKEEKEEPKIENYINIEKIKNKENEKNIEKHLINIIDTKNEKKENKNISENDSSSDNYNIISNISIEKNEDNERKNINLLKDKKKDNKKIYISTINTYENILSEIKNSINKVEKNINSKILENENKTENNKNIVNDNLNSKIKNFVKTLEQTYNNFIKNLNKENKEINTDRNKIKEELELLEIKEKLYDTKKYDILEITEDNIDEKLDKYKLLEETLDFAITEPTLFHIDITKYNHKYDFIQEKKTDKKFLFLAYSYMYCKYKEKKIIINKKRKELLKSIQNKDKKEYNEEEYEINIE